MGQKHGTDITMSAENIKKTLHQSLSFTAIEQYKLMRTNIQFMLSTEIKCPIIGVTSSIRHEGKSTTAVNLSYVLAEQGSRILLIDGDLRIPSVAKKMGIKSTPGLTDLLMNKKINISYFQSQLLPNWYILPAGSIPPNPSELLGSERMGTVLSSLQEHFDYIVIDLPPVNIVSDALSVSKYISGMVVVVREGYSKKRELDQCIRQIQLANVKVLGITMNGANYGGGTYSRYKKYRYYKYYRYYRHDKYGAYSGYEQKTRETQEAPEEGVDIQE